jgi:hypothetical protein
LNDVEPEAATSGTGRGRVASLDARDRIAVTFFGFLGLLVTIADPSFLGSTSSHPFSLTVSASLLPPQGTETTETKENKRSYTTRKTGWHYSK